MAQMIDLAARLFYALGNLLNRQQRLGPLWMRSGGRGEEGGGAKK